MLIITLFLYFCSHKSENMEHRKLRFALFGNIYQTNKSASIQKVLSTLSDFTGSAAPAMDAKL